MNDQQILIEFFKSFGTLQCLVVTEAHTYLKLQVCLSMYDLLLLSGVKRVMALSHTLQVSR